jgi:ElaB/YqjD/DUF883 family membrane-anchored ribosome-binding protein
LRFTILENPAMPLPARNIRKTIALQLSFGTASTPGAIMSTSYAAEGAQSRSATTSNAAREEAKQDLRDSYSDLRGDVASLTEAVKRLANAELGGAVGDAQQMAEKGLSSIETSIRKHPTQAALVAAGVGFLVGLLLIR